MNLINTVIVDSEQTSINHLSNMLSSYCPDVEIKGTARNITDAQQLIGIEQPELVFLDIHLPNDPLNNLFEQLVNTNFNLVITSLNKRGPDMLRYTALDHLYKPVKQHELLFIVNKHKQIIDLKTELKKLKNKQAKTIGLSNLNEIQFVHIDNIIRLEAASNYTHFYLDNGEKITVSNTLKHYETILDTDCFMRVHQSHIVNLNKVKKYVKGCGGYAVMNDGHNVCISATKKNNFFKALQFT